MDKSKLQILEDSIRNASPLELASKLQEAELYDKKETRAVVALEALLMKSLYQFLCLLLMDFLSLLLQHVN